MSGVRSPLRGLFLLGFGRARGVEDFGDDRDSYLTSLAPFVALAIVAAVVGALGGHARQGLVLLLRQLCVLLAPAVLAELFCRVWRRPWLRYATIVNWSIWLQLLVISSLYALLVAAMAGAVPAGLALGATFGGCAYLLAFQWFVARAALGISHARVALLLIANVIVMTALSLYGLSPAELERALHAAPAAAAENGSGS